MLARQVILFLTEVNNGFGVRGWDRLLFFFFLLSQEMAALSLTIFFRTPQAGTTDSETKYLIGQSNPELCSQFFDEGIETVPLR